MPDSMDRDFAAFTLVVAGQRDPHVAVQLIAGF
jgi:hypothetical protein